MNVYPRQLAFFAGLVLPLSFSLVSIAEDAGEKADALKLFEQRIMPIFRSPKPSSCVQCHLAAVDLKNYILPSHRDTFLSLREEGLIDVDQPERSKILTLIRMGDKDMDRGAKLIHEKTRKAELEAFSAWIEACCGDAELVTASFDKSLASVGPARPIEVVRHARKSRLAESFTRNVWSQRMRCFPCHTPAEIDDDNPKHKVPKQRHADFVKKYGLKMNLFAATPEATMAKWMMVARHPSAKKKPSKKFPLVNLDEPARSLIVLKPTAKLPPKKDDGTFEKPSSSDPVSHMGGLKMHVNDQSYKAFIAWIEDYRSIMDDAYETAADLPQNHWIPTQKILRIREVPENWGSDSVVQLFVHKRHGDGWSDKPVAFTQGTITPRRFVNGPLFLLGPIEVKDDHHGRPLAPGKFLIKAYVDQKGQIAESPSVMLGDDSFAGQAEIDAKWQIGFPKAETFSAQQFEKK